MNKTYETQVRTMMARYERYRVRVLEMIRKGAQKPVARVSLALVGTLVFAAFLGLVALRPTLVTISELVREIQDERRVIEALDRKIGALGAAVRILEEMEDRLFLLEDAIPPRHEIEVFAKEAELLAASDGLVMLELTQPGFLLRGEEGPGGGIKTLPVSLSVGGAEGSIRAFVADLELLDRLVVLRAVNLAAVPEEDRQDQPFPLRATINIDIFYQ